MGRTDRLRADAGANCTMKRGDRVTLAGTGTAGTIVQDGGYGYFKVRLADGQRVIRRYTELALTPGA
jgi:hypothetical protein